MKATYSKAGFDYLPAIKYDDGRIKVLFGATLATAKVARKYAQLTINSINSRGLK